MARAAIYEWILPSFCMHKVDIKVLYSIDKSSNIYSNVDQCSTFTTQFISVPKHQAARYTIFLNRNANINLSKTTYAHAKCIIIHNPQYPSPYSPPSHLSIIPSRRPTTIINHLPLPNTLIIPLILIPMWPPMMSLPPMIIIIPMAALPLNFPTTSPVPPYTVRQDSKVVHLLL